MLLLMIDYREREFIKLLSEHTFIENDHLTQVSIGGIDVYFKVCSLPVGDFVIQNVEGDHINVVIERKTINDLCCSIIDNRFREQKARLLTAVSNPNKVMYIIEGDRKNKRSNINDIVLNGALLNLVYKHHYKLLQTSNIKETYDQVLLLYKKITSGDIKTDMVDIKTDQNILENKVEPKMVTKGAAVIEDIFVHQLCVIPGVSRNTATKIRELYKNMNVLISEYTKLNDTKKCEEMLVHIQLTERRKLGKALSKKIYELLVN